MLVQLELKNTINEEMSDRGVVYSTSAVSDDSEVIREFIAKTVPNHPFWSELDAERYKEPQTVMHVLENRPGIYWAWNLHSDLRDTFNVKLIEHFPDFILGTGECFTRNDIREIINLDDDVEVLSSGKRRPELYELTGSYGVADNIDQVLERYKTVIDNPDVQIVISIAPIHKKDQPERGGWRWHKWGAYIGTHEPQYEYLYDESDIDSVIVFHVMMVELVN